MALTFNLTKIKDYKTLCWTDAGQNNDGEPLFQVAPVTDALIWLMMFVGQRAITEKTAEEVFMRISMWESVIGPTLMARPMTMADITAHIGLSTNVGNESKTVFHKKLIKDLREKATHLYESEIAALTATPADDDTTTEARQ
jgi:hypothetical protein